MPDNLYHSNFNFYQNANADASEIKDNFLVRQIEYRIIIENIQRNYGKTSTQHYLLVGRRGSGKSTLLKRLQVEIETDSKLRQLYLVINPAEEQANMYRLYDLLEEIIRELEYNNIEVGEYEFHEDAHAFTRQLFSMIHAAVERSGKKLILLLDNMDRIFDNVGEDAHLLREDLLNYSGDIKIIGASTRVTEHFWRYDKPFYEFFRIMKLDPLTSEEMKALLLHWSKKMDLPRIEEFVKNKPGQLETIRILTDGLPRTLQFFVNILLTRAPETGYEYLRLIMDSMTPLYQERLNALPPAQRKIVLQMAFIWEAAGAGDIAAVTRMENNVVSAQLKQLTGKGIAEKLDTGGRNHLYRLAERFFNLWLIFTQGSPGEKRKAKFLTIFLESIYDKRELVRLAKDHLKDVLARKVDPDKAALLTKAYSQSGHISSFLRNTLIESTLLLPGIAEELKKQLPHTIVGIIEQAQELMNKKAVDKAFELVNSIDQTDGVKEYLLGVIHVQLDNYAEAKRSFVKAQKQGYKGAFALIAIMCLIANKSKLAEDFGLIGIAEGDKYCDYAMPLIYYKLNKLKETAIRQLNDLQAGDKNGLFLYLSPVLKAWNGEFKGINEELIRLAAIRHPMIGFTLMELLIHDQGKIVNDLFQNKDFGKQLIEQLLPLAYISKISMPQNDQVSLKIPPELLETVENLLREIREKQQFYYGRVSAWLQRYEFDEK